MKIALYSELGRQGIIAAREAVRGLAVREARRRILALPAGHPARRVARYPGDAAAASFDNWADFEASEPDTFSAMYQFWVRR